MRLLTPAPTASRQQDALFGHDDAAYANRSDLCSLAKKNRLNMLNGMRACVLGVGSSLGPTFDRSIDASLTQSSGLLLELSFEPSQQFPNGRIRWLRGNSRKDSMIVLVLLDNEYL